jgi:hypothetical protein
MQVHVEVPEDVDNGRMKGESKPRKQEIAKDDNLIVTRFGTVSRPGALVVPIMRFF